MGPANCNIHGMQAYVTTSPRLAEAIENKEFIDACEFTKIIIHSPDLGRQFEHVVDKNFAKSIFDDEAKMNEITLIDRDKKNKKLNDRLLIQRISKNMKWVCPVCLNEISKGE